MKTNINIDLKTIEELFELMSLNASNPPTEAELVILFKTIKKRLSEQKNLNLNHIKKILPIDISENSEEKESSTKSILVIDDLVMVTYQLSIILSKIGYKVTLARSAPEALSTFKTQLFDYVLMDFHIPDKNDGVSLLRSLKDRIQSENFKTKIIVMSSLASPEIVKFCLENGAISFIEKNEDWKQEIIHCLKTI